jgi:hypothetical protein
MADADLLAVDGSYGPLPAGEGFFEADFDLVPDVVAVAFEERMIFL